MPENYISEDKFGAIGLKTNMPGGRGLFRRRGGVQPAAVRQRVDAHKHTLSVDGFGGLRSFSVVK